MKLKQLQLEMPRQWARKVIHVVDNLKGERDPDAFIFVPDDQEQKAIYDLTETFTLVLDKTWMFEYKTNKWKAVLQYKSWVLRDEFPDDPLHVALKGKEQGLYIYVRVQ